MEYTLTLPQNVPGVYMLKNKITGQMYFGETMDLRTRYRTWLNHQKIPSVEGDLQDWVFVVLVECPGASVWQLTELENKAIKKAMETRPDKVVNTYNTGRVQEVPIPKKLPKIERRGRKSNVSFLDGEVRLSYKEAAERLGIKVQTLYSRVKERGIKGDVDIRNYHT